jgi:tetratricopeptide (TPR) repeat protein
MEDAPRALPRAFVLYLVFFVVTLAWALVNAPLHPILLSQYLWSGFVQNPWEGARFLHIWGGHLRVVALSLGFLGILLATGERVLQSLRVVDGEEDPQGDWAWSLALGVLIWGSISTALAMNGLLIPSLMIAVLAAVLTGFLLAEGKRFVTRLSAPLRLSADWPVGWRIVATFLVFLTLAALSAPEMSWDAMTHQLNLPKQYLSARGFFPAERMPPAHSPSMGQMLHAWGLALGDDRVARVIHLSAFVATLCALFSYGRRLYSPAAGSAAVMLYGSTPFVLFNASRGYVDQFPTLLAVLGILGLVCRIGEPSWEGRRDGEVLRSAVALAAVGAFKYSAPLFWSAGVLLLVWGLVLRRWGWRMAAAALLLPLLFAAPWLLKNACYTGNPVYPYLADRFATADWTAFDARASSVKFPVEGLRGLLRLPMVLHDVLFRNYGGATNEDVGPLLALLAPLALLGPWRVSRGTVAMIAVIPAVAFPWLVTSHQVRLVMALLAVGALLGARALERAAAAWPGFARFPSRLILVVLALRTLSYAWGWVQQSNPLPHALGLESRERYLGAVLRPEGYLAQAQLLGRRLPPDARVLLIGLANGYYLSRPGWFDLDHVEPALKVWSSGCRSAGEIHRRFRRRGCTHVLYHAPGSMGAALRARELGLERYGYEPLELRAVEDFFLRFTRPVPLPLVTGFSLYELGPREGFSPPPAYLPGTESAYLEGLRELLGVPSVRDLAGKRMDAEAMSRVYPIVNRLLPGLGLAWFQTAYAVSERDNAAAMAAGKRGLALNGDTASWRFLQGHLLLVRGRSRASIPYLEEAVKAGPERADAASNLAVAYYNVRLYDEALAAMEYAASLEPGDPEYAGIVRQWRASRSRGK